ncbi:MAG: efflux RND transporter periplasmic adaptor subunit [Burkholderiaceae bacterium]
MNAAQPDTTLEPSTRVPPEATQVLIGRDLTTRTHSVLAQWPPRARVSAMLTDVALLALETDRVVQRRISLRADERPVTVVASPLPIGEPPRACATAVIIDADPASGDTHADAGDGGGSDDPLDERNRAASVIRLLDAINGHDELEGTALAYASELVTMTAAERVSVGFVSGESVQIQAMSNTPRIRGRHPLIRDLAQAMDEAIDQAATVVYPAESGSGPRITLAHGRFATRHGCALICTVPILVANDRGRAIIGAVSLEYGSDRQLDARAIRFIENTGSLLGPALDARRRLATPIAGRLASSLASRPRELLRESSRARQIAYATGALLLAAIAFLPLPYHITADARIEGASQQVLAAPVAGYIGTVYARPGDHVLAGQPVVELDDRELRLEKRRWSAELAQIEKRYGDALAKEDQTEIAVQRARISQARAQISIIDKQLARIRLVAPYDGLVISGDLAQSLGAPVKRGETLVTIAPVGEYRIMVQVDERQIDRIREGQKAQVLLPALPGEQIDVDLQKLIPVAELKNGRNVFEVQARLVRPVSGMRPGLSGVARIDAGSRPLLASLTEDLRHWTRMKWWQWGL